MNLPVPAPLDSGFAPLSVALRAYEAANPGAPAITFGIERDHGFVSAHTLALYPDAKGLALAERVVKSLLWMRGGFRVHVCGDAAFLRHIADAYRHGGARDFDARFIENVYERPFEVVAAKEPPETREASAPVGRHLDGCRIGFDAGGSDRKVSAVVDGVPVYSEEVVWFPKIETDPEYHYRGILEAMQTAAARMPRVDAIGVSSAGIYIDNRVMAASLFLKVSEADFKAKVKDIYIRAARAIGDVPLTVANDGDVTALAGAMELKSGNVMGIAMGTSEAGGFVDGAGNITGWLNELAFVPVDMNPEAMRDEWSGDIGCGVKYFSQDAVIKLAPAAGIELDPSLSPGEKLKVVQRLMEQGDPRAPGIYQTIGVYLGYTLAWYARFYDIRHLLLMGRTTSGAGGALILEYAKRALAADFPEISEKIQLHLPDESSRRVGQSVAAASLPQTVRRAEATK